MPDFHSGKDLLKLCRSKNKKISDVMREREIENGAWTEKEIKTLIGFRTVNGKRQMSITLSPGCHTNKYVYTFKQVTE